MFARGIEQSGQEQGGAADLLFDLQLVQRQHHGGAMLADARGQRLDLARSVGAAIDHDVAEFVRQAGEIAFGVDHHLLHQTSALFEQAAQEVRFARAGIALDEQARGEEFLHVHGDGLPARLPADFDLRPHANRDRGLRGQGKAASAIYPVLDPIIGLRFAGEVRKTGREER